MHINLFTGSIQIAYILYFVLQVVFCLCLISFAASEPDVCVTERGLRGKPYLKVMWLIKLAMRGHVPKPRGHAWQVAGLSGNNINIFLRKR